MQSDCFDGHACHVTWGKDNPSTQSSALLYLNARPPGCVHANCGFKYSIPPTKFITNPFVRPAKADFLFGYTYSGFATLQK